MNEMRRLLDEKGDDAATLLLGAARADHAPAGSRARAMAALGIDAGRKVEARAPLRLPLPARRAALRPRRPAEDSPPPQLFQSVLGLSDRPAGLFGKRRLGAFVAASQIVLLALVLLSRPMRRPEASHGPAGAPQYYPELELEAWGPKRIGGRDPVLTREAREARVAGVALVECYVTEEGATRDCRLLRSLPHMDDELLAAAHTWRFAPATQDGRPVSSRRVFKIDLTRP